MSNQFDKVSIVKKANIYFDGKCVSYNVHFPDGSRKSVGVIFPSVLKFNTGTPEVMELNAGKCRVRLQEGGEWSSYEGGQRFEVPGNSSFDIEVLETVDYICHYG